jgi:uncharacterized membrane protein
MSDLSPRPGHRPSRAQREQRVYRLVVASAVLGTAGVVVLVLAIVGVASLGLAFLLLVLAAAGGLLTRRMLAP